MIFMCKTFGEECRTQLEVKDINTLCANPSSRATHYIMGSSGTILHLFNTFFHWNHTLPGKKHHLWPYTVPKIPFTVRTNASKGDTAFSYGILCCNVEELGLSLEITLVCHTEHRPISLISNTVE